MRSLKFGLAAIVLTATGITSAEAQMRFQGMDRDRDGMITRNEWNGSDQAFRNQDWNGDGVLSGDEVRPGARRQTSWNQDWNHDGIVDQQDTAIAQRFRGYDRNTDSRVSANEWPGNQALFRRLDANRDGYLSMAEYTNASGSQADSQGGPAYTFVNIDRNRDGFITRSEWRMGDADFNRLDVNRDNRISNYEFQTSSTGNYQQNDSRFLTVDRNRDGWVTRSESGMTNAEFDRLDTNSDNRLSRFEFDSTATDTSFGATDRFSTADRNRDNYIGRNEWSWGDSWFDRTDTNRDNRISRAEFDASSRYYNDAASRYDDPAGYQQRNQNQNRTRAFQAGFDRGVSEGQMAGREDHANGHGWDLEGQTELERADSGYYSQLGSLGEYQTGYREGFRQAYRDGYNSR
jgi:Ca2+-binding EF-hand superfamily protein